jgi:small-conductance mechanosensitive channel
MNFQIVIDSLTKIVTDIVNFIPNLINGLIILLVGVLVARLARWLLQAALVRLRFDPLVERAGLMGALRGLGVRLPLSRIVAQLVFVLLLLSFLITATRLMGLEAVARLLEQLLQFLPNIVAAAIVFVLGGIAAQFVGGLVTAAATTAGVANATRIGRIVQHLISLFVVIVALGQLGLDTAILVTALTIAIAAFGLALGLALGLGARGVVQHILAGFYLRQQLPAGQPVVFGELRGELRGVGSVSTVLATEAGRVFVPNHALLEATVEAPAPPAPPQEPTP